MWPVLLQKAFLQLRDGNTNFNAIRIPIRWICGPAPYTKHPPRTVKGFFIGPQGSPYADGLFSFTYTFPKYFPYRPPVLKILTKILHPAVINGKLRLDRLRAEDWDESTTLSEVLLQLLEELENPSFEDCLNQRAKDHYHAGKFQQKAQATTRRFAM